MLRPTQFPNARISLPADGGTITGRIVQIGRVGIVEAADCAGLPLADARLALVFAVRDGRCRIPTSIAAAIDLDGECRLR